MHNRIVVGTDGSETAERAVDHAIELAALCGAALSVVSAAQPVSETRQREARGEHLPGDLRHGVGPRDEVNLVLDGAAGRARTAGIEVSTHPMEGDPAEALLDVAEQTKADLIMVGNRGMKGARRLLGSVPNNVSHHSPCSVYIVQTT